MTADVGAAKRSFYGALFGWETEDYPGGGGYVLIRVGGEAVGGMMVRAAGVRGDAAGLGRLRHGGRRRCRRPPGRRPWAARYSARRKTSPTSVASASCKIPQGATLCAMQYLKRA
jgi:hypothetical protein